MNIKYKNISLILIILSGIFILLGSTFAYWTWNSTSNKQVSLVTSNGLDKYIEYDSGTAKFIGDFNLSSNYYEGVYTTVSIKKNSSAVGIDIYGRLYMDINIIDNELSNYSGLKWVVTLGDNTSRTVLNQGDFLAKTNNSSMIILNNIEVTTSIKYLTVWIWLDENIPVIGDISKTKIDTNIWMSVNQLENMEPSAPELDNGLIPVVFDTSGSSTLVKSISSSDSNWYDYGAQKWANAVLTTSTNRSTYKNNPGTPIPESEILAYYVWIPRYSYKIWYTGTDSQLGQEQTIDIRWEDKNAEKSLGTIVGSYLTHPAFTFGDKELNGIWVGKFEVTGTGTTPTILPDVQSLRSQNVSTEFITSLKFAGGTLNNGNVTFSGSSYYGLSTNIDSHMIKNIEWAAVSYLTHSIYGINREVYINNSSNFYTGRSGGNISGQTQIKDIYQGMTETDLLSTYGYYTWDGYLLNYNSNTKSNKRDLTKVASTTGNIYGVYDMAGGAWEYVMGNSNNHTGISIYNNSGFTGLLSDNTLYEGIAFPPLKYYDLYTTWFGNACNGVICLGHGLTETRYWYGGSLNFVNNGNQPWLAHSNSCDVSEVKAGIFTVLHSSGAGMDFAGFHTILSYVGD